MSSHIVDDEQRRDRSQSPCALQVPAPRGPLWRWRSSAMYINIAYVAPPFIRPRGSRKAAPPNSRAGSWNCSVKGSGPAHLKTTGAQSNYLDTACTFATFWVRR